MYSKQRIAITISRNLKVKYDIWIVPQRVKISQAWSRDTAYEVGWWLYLLRTIPCDVMCFLI